MARRGWGFCAPDLPSRRRKKELSNRARDDAMRVQAPLDWGEERRLPAVDVDDFFDKPEDDD